MSDKISEIKKLESEPKIIKNLFNKEEINEFLNLYKILPITVHNKKQNVIKKRWLQGFNVKLEKIFYDKLQNEIGDFIMDNLKDENGKEINQIFQSTAGRFLLANFLPKHHKIKFTMVDRLLTKKNFSEVIDTIFRFCGQKTTVIFCDKLKDLGFNTGLMSCLTIPL